MAQRDLAKLVVRLEAQTSKYVRELDKANAKLQSFEAATKRGLSGIDTAFKRILTGAAVAALARSVVDLSDRYTQLQNRLRLVTRSSSELRAVEDALFASAQRTRTSFESTVDLYARIARSSSQLGLSQQQLLSITESVNQAIIISGTTTQEASAGVIQFGQALASGRLAGDELRSILENMPRLARALADGLGVSIGQLRKMGSEGELTADRVIKALQSQAPKLTEEFGKTQATIGQAFTNLQGSLVQLIGRLSQSTFAGGLADAINALAKNIDNLARSLAVAGVAAGVFAVALQADRIFKAARAFYDLFSAVASGRAILLGSAVADRAKAVAAVQAAQAEVARTTAVLAATRAEQAKAIVVADATVADLARAAAARQVAILEAQAAGAQIALSKAQTNAAKTAAASTGALGLVFARLPAPIKALFALIRAHPIGALVSAIAAAVTALVVFSDKIKTSKDGVITLRDTAIAAWQLLTEGIAPIGRAIADTFARIRDTVTSVLDLIRERFGGLIELAKDVGSALRTAFNFLPSQVLANLLKRGAGVVFDKVQERARQIAEARKKAAEESAKGGGGGGGGDPPDPNALKAIQDMEKALRKQIIAQRDGAVAALKHDIAQGDLAETFAKAGAAANPYRASLVALTSQLEALKLQDLADDLQEQVATYNLTGAAALRYRLEVGSLSKTLKSSSVEGKKAAEEAIKFAEALERLQVDRALRDINAELLELRGNTAEAFRIRLEVENLGLRTQLTNLGDSAGLAQLDELEKLKVAQAEFNALETEAGRIRDELAIQEQRIQTNREVGALTEIAALEKISAAREVSVAQLDTVLTKMRAIAEESGNPALIRNVQQMGAEFEKLSSQVNLVGQAIQSSFEEAAEGPLTEFLLGLQSAEDALQSFFKTIEREIAQFVARDLIKRMFGDLFSQLASGGAGGGSSSGWIGQFVGGLIGLFGGAGSAAGAAAGGNFSGPRAMGGPVTAGQSYLVGERGPELMVPRQDGVVVPNHDLRGMMRDQRSVEVVNNFTIQAPQGSISRQTQSQIAALAARGTADAARRNN